MCACQNAQAEAGSKIQLGKSSLNVSKLGLGTLQWGDPGQGYGERYTKEDLRDIFNLAIKSGINYFDTAEVYGYQGIKKGQSSEQILGSFISDTDPSQVEGPLVIGTKFFTIPWTNVLVGGGFRIGKESILEALTGSLQKLATVDLYQVHFPFPTFPQQVLADALTEIMEKGLVKAVGVCNYDLKQLTQLNEILSKRGIPIASNQVKCSILEQKSFENGLLQGCRDMGITMVAHSPLSQGLLTDKYVLEGGGGKADKIRPLLKLMQFIGSVSGGKSVTQVSLNYLIAQGIVPIPGAKSLAQAKDALGALEWNLEGNEVAMINEKLTAMNK